MMRNVLYDQNLKSMAENQEQFELHSLSIGDLETLIVKSVTDHRRLLIEALQLENYLFTPLSTEEANENKAQPRRNLNGPFCDWGLKM